MVKKGYCIHHTHWDLIWYFTWQDAEVQLSYNIKEMLNGFRTRRINNFFLDGQTEPLIEYLSTHPQDLEEVKNLIKKEKLVVGPFDSQLDCFISSGESVINNLRLGRNYSLELGKVSNIAYLPDSFGHSIDFPKIFNQFNINEFVITRGVGQEYNLKNEFLWKSNDGSTLLVATLLAGYGYGCEAFNNGTLFTEDAVDYNKIKVSDLIDRVTNNSSVEDTFVFPLGFDQNPAILDISKKIKVYNEVQSKYLFIESTWKNYFDLLKESNTKFDIFNSELLSTQYHRVHRSIYSGRADIKAEQDKCERMLTFEVQPLMSMLDSIGIEYNHGLIDKAWSTLTKCQSHSSANLTNDCNSYIKRETLNALNLSKSLKEYLLKILTISIECNNCSKLLIANTLPYKRKIVYNKKILTKNRKFKILHKNKEIKYCVISSVRKNNGVLRKDVKLDNLNKFYYETLVSFEYNFNTGISYEVLEIKDNDDANCNHMITSNRFIENNKYKIYKDSEGITIYDKFQKKTHIKAMYIQDSGDEGDSFDYSYPTEDLIINNYLDDAEVCYSDYGYYSEMIIRGKFNIPNNLNNRKKDVQNNEINYEIKLNLESSSDYIRVSGFVNNESIEHRVRICFSGNGINEHSYAGTQFSTIKRNNNPDELKIWKEKKYFEEPSPIYPFLNHVSLVSNETMTVYTSSAKEYEIINENYSDIAVTLFRSYGYIGLPDLNRRPGRPSGLDYTVFESSDSYMIGKNYFDLALEYSELYQPNYVFRKYSEFATSQVVFQDQQFDKAENPITYFPTNKLEKSLPRSYNFIELCKYNGCFGSVVKCDRSDNYILRLFNAEEKNIDVLIESEENLIVSGIDLNEKIITNNFDKKNIKLSNFELKMIGIKKGVNI
jgi:mannosylglycerate hydrolase